MTDRVRRVAQTFARDDLRMEVCNPAHGPLSIENAAQRAQAEQMVMALLEALPPPGPHAFVLACFDDLALHQARALTGRPVVGTCEAGIAAARAVSPRFAIVTTVHDAVPGIRAMMHRYGAGPLATVRAAGIGVAAAAAAGPQVLEVILETARTTMRDDGAQAILLASGGLTGLAGDLSEQLGVPVIDGVQAAIAHAAALLGATLPRRDLGET
ncbi:MAG: Asp/Glu racemase [Rhodoferax sp.]|nr:Asp/Glu racemase [Rhodoferax sp.]